MKIELKNIRRAEFASHETDCFEASVWIDGKRAGTVENSGTGGCNFYHPTELGLRLADHAKTLPKVEIDLGDGQIEMMQPDADMVIGEILENHLAAQQLRRTMKTKLMWRDLADGQIYQSKKALRPDEMRQRLNMPREDLERRLKASVVLNLLSLEEAVAEFRRKAAPAPAVAA